jgi:Na+-transporting methylmalonyl-CoA/oxaloacetate decarboxylase gamma subunit
MGLVVLVIIIAAVAIPVIQNTLASSNITGTTATLLSMTPVFLALLVLILAVRPISL